MLLGTKSLMNGESINHISKLEQCLQVLGIKETDEEPFITLSNLKQIRDEIAHPKPTEETVEISSINEVWEHLNTEWQNICTPEFAINSFNQVKEFESKVLENVAIAVTAFLNSSSVVTGR